MGKKDSDRQKLFIKEYLVDLSAMEAAIRAGYSPKTAKQMGYKLLQNETVQAAIQKEMAKRAKRTEITADDVLQRFDLMSKANIADYMDVKTILIKIGETEEGEPIYEKRDEAILKDLSQMSKEETYAIEAIKYGKYGLEFKLVDKKGATDSIGKHLGMFVEKVQHSGEVVIIKGVDMLED